MNSAYCILSLFFFFRKMQPAAWPLASAPQSAVENRTPTCSLTCGLLAENVPLEEQEVSSASRLPRQKKFSYLTGGFSWVFRKTLDRVRIN